MKTDAAKAAQMIRKQLRLDGITAKVTSDNYAGGSSVDVNTTDLTHEQVKRVTKYINQFQYGNYDGFNDYYDFNNSRTDIPQVKYVFLNNSYSPEVRQTAWDWLKSNYAGMEKAPEHEEDAHSFYSEHHKMYGSTLLHRRLQDFDWEVRQ